MAEPPTDYIALAVPLFFLGMGVEALVARARRRGVYRLADARADLACGMSQQLLGLFIGATLLGVYVGVHDRARLFTFAPGSLAPWLVAFVGVDFLYYWWHRASHEINLLWAAHIVHHQSEDYNLAVALRQSVLTDWTALGFYLPLAIVGVPPLIFVTVHSFSTLYQFWIHTELVGPLGPVEGFVNTPMAHRVHHAINPQYLDRNYGATLMIWDRLFGTWEAEVEPPVYGITKPLRSFNPLWAQLHYLVAMARMARQARGLDRARVLWRGPAWRPAGAPVDVAPPRSTARADKYDPRAPSPIAGYTTAWFSLVLLATGRLLLAGGALPGEVKVAAALLIGITVIAVAGLDEQRPWARGLEAVRLALLLAAAIAGAALHWLPLAAALAGLAVVVGSSLWLVRAGRRLTGVAAT